jgi:nicotinamide phosphoribosyltransferase
MKATYGEVNGRARVIFKDPKTDDGAKRSARGLLCVQHDADGKIVLKDNCSWEEANTGLLRPVFRDGRLLEECTLAEIRERLKAEVEVPGYEV